MWRRAVCDGAAGAVGNIHFEMPFATVSAPGQAIYAARGPKPLPGLRDYSWDAIRRFEAADDHVGIEWVEFEAATGVSSLFAADQRRARSKEWSRRKDREPPAPSRAHSDSY